MMFRVGMGYDIHRLAEGRKLFLGGVEIPYFKGLLGHSDGDVLLHAICDALLGALAQGDIGEHFPDTDRKYHGISSSLLVKEIVGLVKKKDFKLGNIDTVVIAQEPVLLPFKKQIKDSLIKILGVKEESISVKAKTNEGMGEIGRNEAIAAYAVVLISREEDK